MKAGSGTRPSSAVWVTPVPPLFCYNGSKRRGGEKVPSHNTSAEPQPGQRCDQLTACAHVRGRARTSTHRRTDWMYKMYLITTGLFFHSVVCLEMQRSDSLGQRSNSIIEYVIELRTGCPYIKKSSSNKFDITNRSNEFTRPIKYSRGR